MKINYNELLGYIHHTCGSDKAFDWSRSGLYRIGSDNTFLCKGRLINKTSVNERRQIICALCFFIIHIFNSITQEGGRERAREGKGRKKVGAFGNNPYTTWLGWYYV